MLMSPSTFTMIWHASKAYHIPMLWNASVYPGHDSLTQLGWWKPSQSGQANVSYVATKNVKKTTAKFHSTSDYREDAVSISNQHNCTDVVW